MYQSKEGLRGESTSSYTVREIPPALMFSVVERNSSWINTNTWNSIGIIVADLGKSDYRISSLCLEEIWANILFSVLGSSQDILKQVLGIF